MRQVQPQRELSPQDATLFAAAAPGDDLQAANTLLGGLHQAVFEALMGELGGMAVQIQPAPDRHAS